MATGGVIGNGSKVGYSATSPVSWTKVAQVQNVDEFLTLIADDLDTTVYSTSNIMTSAPGMIPAPTFTFTLLADLDQATTASHETLRQYSTGSGHANAGTTIWWRIEVPVNRAQTSFRAFEFQAYVKEWSPSIPIKDNQTIKLSAKFAGTGVAVYNAAASQIT